MVRSICYSAYSRDGITARTPAIRHGTGDVFAREMIICTCKEPAVFDDEVQWCYSSTENTHVSKMEYQVKRTGRAIWRHDRLVALVGVGEVMSRAVELCVSLWSVRDSTASILLRNTVCCVEGNARQTGCACRASSPRWIALL